jgi:hypothetical protein
MENKKEKQLENNAIDFFSLERGVVKAPKFIETFKSHNKWVNYGVDNLYPQELIDLYLNGSSLHTAIIDKTSFMIAGNGFETEGLSPKTLEFIKNHFSNYNLNQIAFKLAIDLTLFGVSYIKIDYSRDKTRIARLSHIANQKVRISKDMESFYVSRDWANYRRDENQPICIPTFDISKINEEDSQLLQIKIDKPDADYYSYPGYTSSINYIKIAREISIYHLKSLQNNLNAGVIITNIGPIPTKEQREKSFKELKDRYAGAEPAGDVMMLYAQNKDAAPIITPMPHNNSDERFKTLIEQVNTNIRLGHNVPSIVANVETAGKLGNATEVVETHKVYFDTKIRPMQIVIEDAINKLSSYNGITEELKLKEFKYTF